MIDTNELKKLAAAYGISLNEEQLGQLDRYASLLVEWNQKFNLTAITQPQQMVVRHFVDSLLLAAHPRLAAGSLVDVGSGAGFPGMVAKVYRPQLQVTLMEPNGKRQQFLQALAQALGVQLHLVKERGEEAARKQWREGFDVATARAVAPLPALCEVCLPLVKPGGCFIAMKGSDWQEELHSALGAAGKLGAAHLQTQPFTLPDGSARSLIVFEKQHPTPAQYPRGGGAIAKRPL